MDLSILLITLGMLFLLGLAADQVGSVTRLPRVTMLLILGLFVGQSGMQLLPADLVEWFDILSIVALTMVAFLLGSSLTTENLARHGRAILRFRLNGRVRVTRHQMIWIAMVSLIIRRSSLKAGSSVCLMR